MKQCPTCRRIFADAMLNFCRADGTRLVSKGVRPEEAATLLFSTGKLDNRFGPLVELQRRKRKPER